MNLLDQTSLYGRIVIIAPAIICVILAFLDKLTNGNIMAGFNTLSPSEKEKLRSKKFVEKTFYMLLILSFPSIICFLLSFIIKDIYLFNNLFMASWGVFVIMVISGIVIINKSME